MHKSNYNGNEGKSRIKVTSSMTMINPNTAGVDVGSGFHWVCVGSDHAEENIRKFGAYTGELKEMAEWLKSCGITSVAMESTGVYWIPLYQILEDFGFDVVLVNARHLKSVSGRPKTDVYDCQWIQRLHSYGLLNASFRPANEICEIRTLKRHRDNLVRSSSRHILHMQKVLQLSNIRLDKAVSDITGKTGMTIIEKILNGERDPSVLAEYRDRHLKATKKEVAKALEGDYREEYLFLLKQAYDSYCFVARQIEDCDREIEKRLCSLNKKIDGNLELPVASKNGVKYKKVKKSEFGTRVLLYKSFGVDLTRVDGFQVNTVLTLLAEIGTDMSKWKTDKHFASWLGLCVNKEISGGRVLKNRTRKVCNRASAALRMAASSLKNSDCYLGVFFRRIRSKAGSCKAITATARKLAVIFYNMVKFQREYEALDTGFYDEKYKTRILTNLKKRAQLMGYELVAKAI